MLVVTVVSLLLLISESTSECPSDVLTGYTGHCRCTEIVSIITMECWIHNVTELMLLSHHYRGIIRTLLITLKGITILPSSALIYDNLEDLLITGSDVIAVNNDSFVGLEGSLSKLALRGTRLEEIPVSAISRLRNLTDLYMEENQFRSFNAPLHNMALRTLVLHHNNISEIGRDVLPESLAYLDLSHNRLFSLNGALNENLTHLVISNNDISNLDGEFNNVPRIKVILAERNRIQSIDECFRGLRELVKLNLAHNRIHEINDGLSGLFSLRNLNLSYNHLTNLTVTTPIDYRRLELIDLSHNNLSHLDERLFYCTKRLNLLNISFNHLNGLDFLVSSEAINSQSEINRVRNNGGCNYIQLTPKDRLGCNFRDNPRLKSLAMTDSGMACDSTTGQAISYLQSKGVIIEGSPCETTDEEVDEEFCVLHRR